MTVSEIIMALLTIAVVVATFYGPVHAVQSQSKIERQRRNLDRKEWVFYSLMTNRRARLHPDFVRGLNTIDIAFNGGNAKARTATENEVIRRWHDLHHELTGGLVADATPQQVNDWTRRCEDKVTDLLDVMAIDLGYEFDREFLRTGGYYTRGAAEHENEMVEIRQAFLKVLRHQATFPVENMTTDGNNVRPFQFPR
jgi:hypothetical protein